MSPSSPLPRSGPDSNAPAQASAPARLPAVQRRGLLAAGTALAAALLGCAAPAGAHARWLDLQVVDRDSGAVLPVHAHAGRRYLAAAEGQRYALRLRNLGGERLLVVLSVDGLNVISGESAAFGQSGYVLGPWQTLEVAGWRKSLDEVAAFEFSALGQSYAARTGRPFDVGVIGAAVFRERRMRISRDWEQPIGPGLRREQALPSGRADAPPPATAGRAEAGDAARAAAPAEPAAARGAAESRADAVAPRSAQAPAPLRERLGTAHGEREHAPARHVAFERDSTQPAQLLALHYDSTANLVALGVLPRRPPAVPHEPSPFPREPRALGFVPDPPRSAW